MYNGKSRHIRRRHNTVRQLLSNEIISIDYIKSKDNPSGILQDIPNRSHLYGCEGAASLRVFKG